MTIFDGGRTSEDPGLHIQRLAAGGTVTKRARRWWRIWNLFGPLLLFAAGASVMAWITIKVIAS